jgi:effector-binding domain-containing protein
MRIPFILFCSLTLLCCANSNPKNETPATPAEKPKAEVKDTAKLPLPEGLQGIVNVPELLTLAIKDSVSNFEEAAFKVAKNFDVIQADMTKIGVEVGGSPGVLFYSNDPKHFVFECVVPLNKMPTKKPKNSTIVILEATRAVTYNYYGPLDKIHLAYDKIKAYINEQKLETTGPSREFYISDPNLEPDPAKWLSKIYVPVR